MHEGSRGKTDKSTVWPADHSCARLACGDGIVNEDREEGLRGDGLLGPARADVPVGVHDEDGCFVSLLMEEVEENQPSVVGLLFRLRNRMLITC